MTSFEPSILEMGSRFSLESTANPYESQSKPIGNICNFDWDALLQPAGGLDHQQLDLLCEELPVGDGSNAQVYSFDGNTFQPDTTVTECSLDISSRQTVLCSGLPVPKLSESAGSVTSDVSQLEAISAIKDPAGGDSDNDTSSERDAICEDDEVDEAELAQEPWFRTLKSAGVRIKGRTRQELIDVAERIRKRRRESAARSRARRINKVTTIADQNEALRRENEELKRIIETIQSRQQALLGELKQA